MIQTNGRKPAFHPLWLAGTFSQLTEFVTVCLYVDLYEVEFLDKALLRHAIGSYKV